VPRLVRRTSYEFVLPLFSAVLLGSMVMFSHARGSLREVVVVIAVAGAGVGSIFAVKPAYFLRAVPATETASATSFNQILRYVGYSVGSALSAVLLQAHASPGHIYPTNGGYTTIGLVSCLVWVLTGTAAIVLPLRRTRSTPGASRDLASRRSLSRCPAQ
jgi:predicted MFS family arabinose efflux permease